MGAEAEPSRLPISAIAASETAEMTIAAAFADTGNPGKPNQAPVSATPPSVATCRASSTHTKPRRPSSRPPIPISETTM